MAGLGLRISIAYKHCIHCRIRKAASWAGKRKKEGLRKAEVGTPLSWRALALLLEPLSVLVHPLLVFSLCSVPCIAEQHLVRGLRMYQRARGTLVGSAECPVTPGNTLRSLIWPPEHSFLLLPLSIQVFLPVLPSHLHSLAPLSSAYAQWLLLGQAWASALLCAL